MPRAWRSVTPNTLPFRNGLTYDPNLRVQVEPLSCPVTEAALWIHAPLTRDARARIPERVTEALLVYRGGEERPLALLLTVEPTNGWIFSPRHRLISTRPEHVRLEPRDRCILLTAERIWTHQVGRIGGVIGDLVAGTMPLPRSARRPASGPGDDLDRLGDLAP